MTTVSIRDTVKRFGTVEVIHGLSMEIGSGEFVVFVGPSGCGKSTLLRMIAGLESFQQGEIAIGGRIVNAVPARDRDIAMVFQDYALYPHMTVEGNLGFGLKMRGVAKAEIARRVGDAARVLQIEHLLARRPRELSGGQRQRVAMGRAIVREPKVFLFDEPLSNLDAKLRVDMRTEIKRLHQTLKATMIYVTHDQVEAMTLADRIVVLNGGVIEQIGSPRDLYAKPATRFVASFIGAPAMNFLPARVADGAAELPGGVKIAVPGAMTSAKVEFGIRPEHLVEIASGAPGLVARVDLVEPLGADTLVSARVDAYPIVARLPGETVVVPGDSLTLGLEPARAHLFDAATGKRL
jgi:multiple sugar transport system ATP-binding protein